ncbi:MAG: hypothetical protein NE334_07400 [Lentisphaeraceae bacterium]|nr:hypothetical protein [Lentisphaeraceae bacterium]
MKKSILTAIAISATALFTSCVHIPGGTNLGSVAKDKGMKNITTGDGTFENYKATGFHTSTEIGLGFGIPGIGKFAEVYPKQTNEEQVGKLADSAKADGANAMINVSAPKETYLGIPFIFFGIYLDTAEGTGIKTSK